jgi:hypothetical protein
MSPPPMQSSLPAGWLAFTGRASNPLDHNKRFQITHPPFLDLSWRYRDQLQQPLGVRLQDLTTMTAHRARGHASLLAASAAPI